MDKLLLMFFISIFVISEEKLYGNVNPNTIS